MELLNGPKGLPWSWSRFPERYIAHTPLSRYYFLVIQAASGHQEESFQCIHSDSIPAGSNPLENVTFERLSHIFYQSTGRHLALSKDIRASHWLPDTIQLEAEITPGCWDKVTALVFNRYPRVQGHEDTKRRLVKDWALLTRSTTDGEYQIQSHTVPNQHKSILENAGSLRGRLRRRLRRSGCFDGMTAAPSSQSASVSSKTPASEIKTSSSLLRSQVRGRRRRQLRRLGDLSSHSPDSSMEGYREKGHREASCSFTSGWTLSGLDHNLPLPEAAQLKRNGVHLQIEMDPLSLRLTTSTGQIVQTDEKSRPHIVLRQANGPTGILQSREVQKSYILVLQYRLPYEGISLSRRRSENARKKSAASNNDKFNLECPTDLSIGEKTRITSVVEDVDNNHEKITLTDPPTYGAIVRLQKEKSQQEKVTVILAQLTDYTGIVKGKGPSPWMYRYFQTVSILPSVLGAKSAPQFSMYWRRLALFVMGDPGYRFLPYSQGYGIKHSNPTPVRRRLRYGYFDVDNIENLPSLPRWRAWWTFDDVTQAPNCECGQFGMRHSIDACAYLSQNPKPEDLFLPPFRVLHESLYFAHWPYEIFSHERVIPWKDAPEEPKTFFGKSWVTKISWNTERNFSRYDVDVDYTRKLPEVEDSTNKIWINGVSEVKRDFEAELCFERGIVLLNGQGIKRDIDAGLDLIVTAAEKGSAKARATVKRLFRVYGRELDRDDGQLADWLLDGVRHGSELALEDIRIAYLDSDECWLAYQETRFAFNLRWQGSLEYFRDVHPHFNLFNAVSLRQMKQQEAGKELLNTVFLSPSRFARSLTGKKGNYSYGTLLHIACLLGHPEAVEILLEAGLDVNKPNSSRRLRTPLHCALHRGHHQIARRLVMKGAKCGPEPYWEYDKVTWPSHIYYLVYILDEKAACDLAELFVEHGAEVNTIYPTAALDSSDLWPLSNTYSVTPLRWAIMHGKAELVRKLLDLGARFPTSKFWPVDDKDNHSNEKLCLHLETPTTNREILQLFFEQLKSYELPLEFSQTPLGLLISEDDTAERRLRLGFGDAKVVIAALNLLLTLQPGYEHQVLWSAVRHNHLSLVQYLVRDKGWSLETRWKGLTMLHTAILYGHVDEVLFLLDQGADATLVTTERNLTCLHLLAMVPRDADTDDMIMDMLSPAGRATINATETRDGLTSLHIAVRNKKLHLVRALLKLGADPLIPVSDQVNLLAEGRSGILKGSAHRLLQIADEVTILAEVLLQCNQDEVYPLDYAEQLVYLFLSDGDRRHLYVDTARTMSILHVTAMLPFSNPHQIYSFIFSCLAVGEASIPDANGDTPLHYACVSYQTQNVHALLDLGANPRAQNIFHIIPTDLAILSSIILGPPICGFQQVATSNASPSETHDRIAKALQESASHAIWRRRNRKTGRADGLRQTLAVFETRGIQVQHPLKQLAMAWGSLDGQGEDQFHALLPLRW